LTPAEKHRGVVDICKVVRMVVRCVVNRHRHGGGAIVHISSGRVRYIVGLTCAVALRASDRLRDTVRKAVALGTRRCAAVSRCTEVSG